MEWTAPTLWWVIAGALVAVELATGTFYLLMLAVGAAAAAVAAHLQLPMTGQLVAAAVVGGGAVVAWHLRRARQPTGEPAGANRDVNLDIGQRVHVDAWNDEGVARVMHRGAQWDARFAGAGRPLPGLHVIRAIEGTQLVLDRPSA